jgi:hypothetical protein
VKHLNLDTRFDSFVEHPQDSSKRVRVAQDVFSGNMYAQIAETVPSDEQCAGSPGLRARRASILAADPIHYASDKPGFTGYWVEYTPEPIKQEATAAAEAAPDVVEIPPRF